LEPDFWGLNSIDTADIILLEVFYSRELQESRMERKIKEDRDRSQNYTKIKEMTLQLFESGRSPQRSMC
jgi:hypothetical protein